MIRDLLPAPTGVPNPGEGDAEIATNFKSAMQQLPSPIAVVTASGPGGGRGVTVSSLTRVSDDPPLLSFCLRNHSRMLAILDSATHFAVHVLDSGMVDVARHFARRGLIEQFDGLDVGSDDMGTPLLSSAKVTLVARHYLQIAMGDHVLIVGAVVSIRLAGGGVSLVHYGREYCEVGAVLPRTRATLLRPEAGVAQSVEA